MHGTVDVRVRERAERESARLRRCARGAGGCSMRETKLQSERWSDGVLRVLQLKRTSGLEGWSAGAM
eukprot:2474253-Rhodomonas_salina.1